MDTEQVIAEIIAALREKGFCVESFEKEQFTILLPEGGITFKVE